MKMFIFKKLKANRVNLWHACYLGVLKGAELESAVYPAQNCKFQDGRHRRAKFRKCSYDFTKQGRNMNKVCFCVFSNMRNPMPYSEVY